MVREGGKRELEWVAVERGIDTLNRRELELREPLKRWFEKRKQMGRLCPRCLSRGGKRALIRDV